jgi:hypothetical protein
LADAQLPKNVTRSSALDIFKGLLVFGMILAHIIQILGNRNDYLLSAISKYINLISFSGFLFAFGYANYFAYFSKDFQVVKWRMFKTGLKILLAFYISGIASRILFEKKAIHLLDIIKIILLADIPGYSEFLASFAIITLLALVLFRLIKTVLSNKIYFCLLNIFLLFTTFIPYERITINQIGLLIGTNNFACFPVIQYSPLYLIGIYFARYQVKLNRIVLLISSTFTLSFISYLLYTHSLPNRFPPSLFWIVGSALFLYIYFLASDLLATKLNKIELLEKLGRNVLFYLLVSNIFIFAIHSIYGNMPWGIIKISLLTAAILFTVGYLQDITRK